MTADNQVRILVVDDEEDIRQLLSRHFRFLGYAVETASNGVEALEVLSRERTEVVISDIRMPTMDGVQLLKRIRNEYPMVHTIIITGYVTIENLLAALRYGADTCVFKPLDDMTELEDAVERAVEHLRIWHRKLKELTGMKTQVGGSHGKL